MVSCGCYRFGQHVREVVVLLAVRPTILLHTFRGALRISARESSPLPVSIRIFEGAGAATQLVRLSGMQGNARNSNGSCDPAMIATSAASRAPRNARRREPAPGTSMTWRLREPRPRREFIQIGFV